MDNIKNDYYYVQAILDDINFVIKHTTGISYEEFNGNELLLDSVMFRLIQISEKSQKFSSSFLEKKLPLKQLKSMRNRIVHDYDGVRLDIIYETVTEDFPVLRDELESVFPLIPKIR